MLYRTPAKLTCLHKNIRIRHLIVMGSKIIMLKIYIIGIASNALRSSWSAINGLEGSAFAGVLLALFGNFELLSEASKLYVATNWLISFAVYAAISFSLIFIIRMTFVSPFKMWKAEKVVRLLDESSLSGSDRAVEHDRRLSAKFREIMPECMFENIISNILNNHMFSDDQSRVLRDALFYLDSAGCHFIDSDVRQKVELFVRSGEKLLEFMSYKFFRYPEHFDNPITFAMQPRWNCDREGDGSPEQDVKYGLLVDELQDLINKAESKYRGMIGIFHEKLFDGP